jgi:hypothetical protein
MVESEKQFLPYLSNALLIETMSTHIFTAIDVIQYKPDVYCLIIGTSHGRLFTAFTDSTFKTTVFEELILPMNMRYSIKSITHKKVLSNDSDHYSYVIIITNHLGYLTVQLTSCQSKLRFQCWMKDCLIQKIMPPMSLIIFILCIFIIILLTKFTRKIKRGRFYPTHSRKTRDSSSTHTYTNNIMYRTNSNKLFIERKNQQHVFPTKSDLCIRRISSTPVYSTVSTQSLPSLVLSTPATISSNQSHPLSVQRLYKNYV